MGSTAQPAIANAYTTACAANITVCMSPIQTKVFAITKLCWDGNKKVTVKPSKLIMCRSIVREMYWLVVLQVSRPTIPAQEIF